MFLPRSTLRHSCRCNRPNLITSSINIPLSRSKSHNNTTSAFSTLPPLSEDPRSLDKSLQDAIEEEESSPEYIQTIQHIPAFSLHQLAKFLPRGIHSGLTPRDEHKSILLLHEEQLREKEEFKNQRRLGGPSFREMGANIVGQDERGVNRRKIYAKLETEELKEMWRLDREKKLKELHEQEENLRQKEESMKDLEKKFKTQTGQKPPPSALYPTQMFGRDSRISGASPTAKKTATQRDKERLVMQFAAGATENPISSTDEAIRKQVITMYRNIYRLVRRRLHESAEQFEDTMDLVRKQFRRNQYLRDDAEITEALQRGEEYVVRLNAVARAKGQGRVEAEDTRYAEELKLSRFHRLRKFWNRYFKQVGSVSETYCRYPQLQPYLSALGINSDSNVLIVGGGVSQVCLGMVRDFDCAVTTVDVSNVAVENMIRWTKAVPAVHFIHGDAGKMQEYFPDQTFDLVFDKGCLDSVLTEDGDDAYVESQRMLLEVWRVLQKGGVYFVVTTLPDEGMRRTFVFMDWILTKVGEHKLSTALNDEDEDPRIAKERSTAAPGEETFKFWTVKKPDNAPDKVPDFAEFEREYEKVKRDMQMV